MNHPPSPPHGPGSGSRPRRLANLRILLTNDDGVHAPGLAALARAFAPGNELIVVAPDDERSATGHAITLGRPLRCRPVDPIHGAPAYAVDGTPADCVKFALLRLCPHPPDLVLSGINRGPNTGVDIRYSGTVAGAMEAACAGLSAVAVSLGDVTPPLRFEAAADAARAAVEALLSADFPFHRAVANLNVPNAERPHGLRVTRANRYRYDASFAERLDPRGRPYYWMDGSKDFTHDEDPGSDAIALRDGYLSITPLAIDPTDAALALDLASRLGA